MSYLSSLDMLDTLLLLNCLTATQIEHLISSLNWVNSHLQCFLYFILCQVVPAFPSVFPLNSLFFLYYTRALKTTVLHLINLFADLWWGWSVVCWLVVGMEGMRQSLCVYDSSVEVMLSAMRVPEARLTYWPTCTRSPFVFSPWLRHNLVGSFLCFSYRNYQQGIICWDTQFCDVVAGTSVSEPKAASGSLFGLGRWCNDGFFPAFGKIRSWNYEIWYISPDSSAFLANLSWFLALTYYFWVCDPFSFILLYPTLLLYLFYFQYILIQT